MKRLLLCRPQGGLNDILVQIEKCCRYAELTGRTVIVDTQDSNLFQDDFEKYFFSKQERLLFSTRKFPVDFDLLDVFPEFLRSRVSSYKADWFSDTRCFCEVDTKRPLTFDFSKDYPQELVVHHDCGGGDIAIWTLLRCGIQGPLVNELKRRIQEIGGPYIAAHVRNSDYKTNYINLIEELRLGPDVRFFLATDDRKVLEDFRAKLGQQRVISFSWLPLVSEKPFYHMRLTEEQAFLRNRDAIVDLLMLALSSSLRITQLEENAFGTKFSGFSMLAHSLWSAKIVLKHLISQKDLRFGLI
jgi:hypothetical protein